MLCFRLLDKDEPGAPLAEAVKGVRSGSPDSGVFAVEPRSFQQIPKAPFAYWYWVSERIRKLFTELPPFEGEGRTVRVGLQTGDDFRFVRLAWETREKLEALDDFRSELVNLRDELLRIAHLPYRPNLNDGVLITASPLWSLFRLPKWRKSLHDCWKKLENGDYDWAHLAFSIWPGRVREKCKSDKLLAIAHGLEDLCEPAPAVPVKERRDRKRSSQAPDQTHIEDIVEDQEE